jgi:hypothetical protein
LEDSYWSRLGNVGFTFGEKRQDNSCVIHMLYNSLLYMADAI